MGIEIERKFLVKDDTWRHETIVSTEAYCQAYLSQYPHPTVRIRTEGSKAFITIKGKTEGLSRPEFEYEIPFEDAHEIQQLSLSPLVTKIRHKFLYEGYLWEVDEFYGENSGLIIAEVEIDHPQAALKLPPWIGKEISDDFRYSNSNLAVHPFKTWEENTK